MPLPAAESGAAVESGVSGIEKSVEAAIAGGNMPALAAAGTQLTTATTQRIASIAAADPNETNLPEQGVIGAIAGQANGLAQEAHRNYMNSISSILQAVPEPVVPAAMAPAPEVVAPPATMPGFEPQPVAAPMPMATPEIIVPPTVEIHPIAIAAQMYLDERDATDRMLNSGQANYEGHSIRTAVPYYEAILAQDPSDQQWQAFVTALKLESSFYESKLHRAELALQVNQLQNEIEDNRKHNILPTSEQAERLKQLQQAFDKANQDVAQLEQAKAKAEEQYHSIQ